MKKIYLLIAILILCFCLNGCDSKSQDVDILAVTAPVYSFASRICQGTDLRVQCLITDNVSCLHDYTLQTTQMRHIESAELVILSGAGLEDNFSDMLSSAKQVADASVGVTLLCAENHHHEEGHEHTHTNEYDAHIWLSPENAKIMSDNIFRALSQKYPQYTQVFTANYAVLYKDLGLLQEYAQQSLTDITSRDIITFHDGFEYLADAFGLHILHAIEEESGREASAAELIELIGMISNHNLSCIFTERNGSTSAAQIIATELDIKIHQLDMAMSGDYFTAMYHNIDTLKEALK